MDIAYKIEEVREKVRVWRKEGKTIGFVPTMGYLHEGHKSLITKCREESDIVIVSIFVNPIQFGVNEDLDKYPRDFERDRELILDAGGDLVFHPEVSEIYPNKINTYVEVNGVSEGLCGAKREGHFTGVATVVTKLFNIINPDRAYFGEKDAQQVAVIKTMVRDLNMPVEIIGCPIVREEDGLAKSSRNVYLNDNERKAALVLNESLNKAKEALEFGQRDALNLIKIIKATIEREPLAKIDYIEIVDSLTLKSISKIETSVLIAIAVYIGKTRLIDNFTYGF